MAVRFWRKCNVKGFYPEEYNLRIEKQNGITSQIMAVRF